MNTSFRATPPPTRPFADIKLPEEEIIRLAGDIDLHVVNTGELPVSRFGIYWEGGLAEAPSQAVASIAGGSMWMATRAYSPESLADVIDFNGAKIHSRLADHFTCLELTTLNSHFDALLPVIGSIASEASFPDKLVAVERSKASAELALLETQVGHVAGRILRGLLHGLSNPTNHNITPAELDAVTAAQCRDAYSSMLLSHKSAFLGGAFDHSTIDTVCRFLESLPLGTLHPMRVVKYEPEPVQRVDIPMPDAKQAAVAMGLPTIGRDHPDYITLRLAVMALGGYFGSRLMANIRERLGLTYGISAGLLGSREGAYMEISAHTDASTVDQVIEETRKEIALLAANPPRGEELHRLKQHAWSALAASVDKSTSILGIFITRLLVATPPDYFQSQLRTIESLTADDIARVTTLYLHPAALRIATAGPSRV